MFGHFTTLCMKGLTLASKLETKWKESKLGTKWKECLIDMKARFWFRVMREFNQIESFYPIVVQVEDPHWYIIPMITKVQGD